MIKPGPRNLITDVDGLRVGNAQDETLRSGTTVLLPDVPAVMAVDVRGGGPGTRETDALDPTCLVERFHGVVLSGGSAFGLAAADGVINWLSGRGVGLEMGSKPIPVVPAAILFDLVNGGDKNWGTVSPYPALGIAACEAATAGDGRDFALGTAGAGYGAQAGLLKGGLGSCSAVMENGWQVGALMAGNPFGDVLIPGTDTFWAWAMEMKDELGGQRPPEVVPKPLPIDVGKAARLAGNTTIGVVATNVTLSKAQAQRIAIMAQDGIARAVRPAHTPFDGDTIFVVSTGRVDLGEPGPLQLSRLGTLAADCVARAICRGVYEAESLAGVKAYRG